jgi:FKBP-type peptidyl-prolyl cis-trans isomerase FkpA
MRKVYFFILAIFVAFTATAQIDSSYKMGDGGMQYKIIETGNGELLKAGQFMEIHFSSILAGAGRKDSLLTNTRDMGAPQMMPFDSSKMPANYFKIFTQMKSGDSLITLTIVDTIFKNEQNGSMPAFFNKGDFIITNIKIVNIYKTQEEADKAAAASRLEAEKYLSAKAASLKIEDDKTIAAFIAKNNVTATKTTNGVYVEIIKLGTGAILDSNVLVKINYTGRTFDARMFDSNTDPSKGHVEPLMVNLTNDPTLSGGVIPGMNEGLMMMQKGTKGKLYIPSGLAYGPRGAGTDIAANANLIFEVEVLSILSKKQAKAENLIQQQKMMAKQMKRKALPKKTKKQNPINRRKIKK